MKTAFKTICYSLICILAFNWLMIVSISAEEDGRTLDTQVVDCPDEEIRERTDRLSLSFVGTNTKHFKDAFVFSFDVSSNNECALLFDNGTIVIYDSDGNVYSVMKFNKDVMRTKTRDPIIKWNGENLEFITGYGITYHFTKKGQILDVWRFQEFGDIPNPKKIVYDSYVYEMKNNNKVTDLLGFGNYNMFAKTADDGTETVLFESESNLPFVAILLIVILSALFMFAVIVLTSTFVMIKARRKIETSMKSENPKNIWGGFNH